MKQQGMFFIKRLFDVIVSAAGLILLSPLLALLAVLVRINLGAPVFFRQERPGLHEKIFRLYKFRSMKDAVDRNGNELPDAVVQRDEVIAYTTFISLLCKMSKDAKRITAKPAEAESEKYAFRCFLLRLGFIGPQHKNARKILLQNLSGSAAFVTKEKADAFSAAQKAKRDATKEVEE